MFYTIQRNSLAVEFGKIAMFSVSEINLKNIGEKILENLKNEKCISL